MDEHGGKRIGGDRARVVARPVREETSFGLPQGEAGVSRYQIDGHAAEGEVKLTGCDALDTPLSSRFSNAFGEAGNTALVLISGSGIQPGFPLPAGDGRIVSLNPDTWMSLGLNFGSLLQGTVDSAGTANTPTLPFPAVASGMTAVGGPTFDLER